jgi:hypothetical protein
VLLVGIHQIGEGFIAALLGLENPGHFFAHTFSFAVIFIFTQELKESCNSALAIFKTPNSAWLEKCQQRMAFLPTICKKGELNEIQAITLVACSEIWRAPRLTNFLRDQPGRYMLSMQKRGRHKPRQLLRRKAIGVKQKN